MSTALLQTVCDFGLEHSTFRNPGTSGITGNGSSGINSTGDKLLHHSAQTQLSPKAADRMTGIYQSVSGASAPSQQTFQAQHHKMSGAGVRRTVSSATPSSVGLSRHLSTSTKVPLSNTQSSQSRLVAGATQQRDPHKKLDRSFSEPAEKKGSSASSNSALGPSSRYKTELCRSFAEVGSCKYGDKCQFAHGDDELRTITRHPKFKTENCKSFHSTGFCPYGPRCHFIHNNDESKKNIMSTLQQSTPVINQRIFDQSIGSTSATQVTGSLLASPASSQIINSQANSTARSGLPVSSVVFTTNVTSAPVPNAGSNLVRPKALSLGSYSLGSSGEMSSPSSHSGSPTSLNSFFTEDLSFGLGSNLVAPGSHLSAFTPHPNSAFSFSPDSAFVSFTPGTASTSAFVTADQTKCVLRGSHPTLNSRFSPEPTIADETANSVISSLFGGSPTNSSFAEAPFMFRAMSPNSKSHLMTYPSSPESPVDSVASEIEALKLGEQPTSFSPISSSFSTSSMSASSASPLNGLDLDAFSLLSAPSAVANSVNIPRLPTFAKFTTNVNGHSGHRHLGSVGSSSPGSPQGSFDSMLE